MTEQSIDENSESFRQEIEKPEFKNWVKGTLAQNIVKTTLCKVIERKWKWFIFKLPEEEKTHLDVFMKCLEECHVKCLETDVRNFNCSHELCMTLLSRLAELCSFPTTFLETEESYARSGSVLLSPLSSLENENKERVAHWQFMFLTDSCLSFYWSLAKLFISTENDVSSSSIDVLDFGFVIGLLGGCKLFSFEGSQGIFKDIYGNWDLWLHSVSRTYSNGDIKTLLQRFVDLLKNFQDSSFYQCSDAIIDIENIMSEYFFNEFSWNEYVNQVKMTLEWKMKALAFHKTSGELANLENSSLDELLSDTNNLLQSTEELLADAKSETKTLETENKKLEDKIKQAESESGQLKSQRDLLQEEKKTLTETIEKLTATVDKLNKELEQFEDSVCPGKPVAVETEESVALFWDHAGNLKDTEFYQIHYKEQETAETGSIWKIYPEQFTETPTVLSDLKPGTTYLFRIAIVNGEERMYSPESDPVTTIPSQASELIENARQLKEFSLAIYLLPMVELEQNDETKIRKYLVGDGSKKEHVGDNENQQTECTLSEAVRTPEWEKMTILILGAKGDGRNIVVDSIMNYVLNVRYDDYFRFTTSQTTRLYNNSQEEWVTYYIVNPEKGNRLKYQLQIINVPGFGDASCASKNQQIMRQIHKLLFEMSRFGNTCRVSICLVVEGTDEVTSQQEYTLQLILSLFGKDVQSNICTVILSENRGGSRCSTLLAEANLIVGKTFYLCKGHLFGRYLYQSSPITFQHNLKAIILVCCEFLAFVEKVEPCSFSLTLEIVEQRIASEKTFANIESGFEKLPSVIGDLQNQIKEKHRYKRNMTRYANYETEITKTNIVEEKLPDESKDVTTCSVCDFTCHDKCKVPEDKERCTAMDSNGFCKNCPKKCKWNLHINTRSIFRHVEVKEKKIDYSMYGNYTSAKSQFSSSVTAVKTQKQRLSNRQKQIDSDISVFESSRQFGNENAIQGYPRKMTTDMVGTKERLARVAKDALDDDDDGDDGSGDMRKDLFTHNQCKTS